jgi:hypothetical protein
MCDINVCVLQSSAIDNCQAAQLVNMFVPVTSPNGTRGAPNLLMSIVRIEAVVVIGRSNHRCILSIPFFIASRLLEVGVWSARDIHFTCRYLNEN